MAEFMTVETSHIIVEWWKKQHADVVQRLVNLEARAGVTAAPPVAGATPPPANPGAPPGGARPQTNADFLKDMGLDSGDAPKT